MTDPSRDEVLFVQLVAMLQMAAMQQMGKLANPITGKIERDLEHARTSIDIVQMLQRKTEGRRSGMESELITKVLFELQMNYVDEVQRAEKERTKTPDPGTGGPVDGTSDPSRGPEGGSGAV